MVRLYRDKHTGERLYPVCSWRSNQHKLYNAYDRAMIRCTEEGHSDESMKEIDKIEKAITAFEGHVIGNLVYETYQERCVILDLIGAYGIRKDMSGNWKN